ncbi:hypothetical protein JWJ90_20475 [Desulfobulbus rhabdoformis]|uniref:hypothetical protein n=1 Tax=Desulfobulbus rhabdoformis TaxID=34032 RepID=UPI001966A4AA|nr:hypothetical protein [Desulfobulbus rhabdoformis]MBM9616646.1 hypothetical protein [Desulfobulbus rhabdoformis]
MAPPETTRQYVPDLEKRWGEFGITRRKIVEYARDGQLDLWIELSNVIYFFQKEGGEKGRESAGSIELKFYLDSLEQLCGNIDISRYYNLLQSEDGHAENIINGILKDGRKVLVKHKQSFNSRRSKELPKKILIEYSKVYAFIEDVKGFERKFFDDEKDISSGTLPFLDQTHDFYAEELAIAATTWLLLYGGGGKYQPGTAHKKQIAELLKGKGLSAAAVERICTLVNPQKGGGAPLSGY